MIKSQAEFDRDGRATTASWPRTAAATPARSTTTSTPCRRCATSTRSGSRSASRQLSFHGSSYGTLLGAQYAETYPHRVRAMVLESVFDHSSRRPASSSTNRRLPVQDSFDEFVKWCDAATTCALHGRDIHALWADLLARAGRGEIPDPRRPQSRRRRSSCSFAVFRLLYEPAMGRARPRLLKKLETSQPPTEQPPVPTGLQSNTLAPFCQDFSLPVRNYREFAGYLQRLARNNPDMQLPGAADGRVTSCLGLPPGEQSRSTDLKVRGLQDARSCCRTPSTTRPPATTGRRASRVSSAGTAYC